jgi:hypothetical protein
MPTARVNSGDESEMENRSKEETSERIDSLRGGEESLTA